MTFRWLYYVFTFIVFSIVFGIIAAALIGSKVPDKFSMVNSKSFQVNRFMLWEAIMDVESYSLWKPDVVKVEMLGKNKQGQLKWREYYPFNRSQTFEIAERVPKTSIRIRAIESNNQTNAVFVYNLSDYDGYGVLQLKYFLDVPNPIRRFIRRCIDTKYSEVDYILMNLDEYMNQLAEDQDDVLDMIVPKFFENTEKP